MRSRALVPLTIRLLAAAALALALGCGDDDADGEPCGPVRCDAGQVCCNPLQGICTAPGEVCIQ